MFEASFYVVVEEQIARCNYAPDEVAEQAVGVLDKDGVGEEGVEHGGCGEAVDECGDDVGDHEIWEASAPGIEEEIERRGREHEENVDADFEVEEFVVAGVLHEEDLAPVGDEHRDLLFGDSVDAQRRRDDEAEPNEEEPPGKAREGEDRAGNLAGGQRVVGGRRRRNECGAATHPA